MPQIRNKKSGIVYEVSDEQLKNMRQGEIFASTFDIIKTIVPPEVLALEKRLRDEKAEKNSSNGS